MKKLILPFVAISMLFAACGETATQEEKTVTTTEQSKEVTEPKKEENTASTGKFSTPEAQKFADEYTHFAKSFIETVKSGDASKVAEVSKTGIEWAKKIQDYAPKLSPEDSKLLNEMAQKYTAEMQAAIQGKLK